MSKFVLVGAKDEKTNNNRRLSNEILFRHIFFVVSILPFLPLLVRSARIL